MAKKYESLVYFLIRLVGALFVAIPMIFFIGFLSTYFPSDHSFFYATTELMPIHNIGGSFGAHCAALFFYLCGGAAFLWVIPLLFVIYIFMRGFSFYDHWERVIAASFGVIVCCALLSTYKVDFFWSPYPGGIIGLFFMNFLLKYTGYCGLIVFLYMSLIASLIIFWRFAHMNGIRYLITMCCYVVELVKQYRLVESFFSGVRFLAYILVVYPIVYLFNFMQSLYDGTAFDGTDLLVPQQEQDAIVFVCEKNDESVLVNTNNQKESITLMESFEGVSSEHTDVYCAPAKENIHDNATYALPGLHIFIYEKNEKKDHDLQHELEMRASILQDKLKRFGVAGEVVAIKRGPVVTLFEYQPDIDTKLSKIISLEDDLAMALQAMSIRILAPIPGKAVVGFEVANAKRNDVLFSHIVSTDLYKNFKGQLPLILGKGTIGESVVVDLARMPHLLIAGSTGSGKSVALNALLISLLCKLDPDELKLILIDPKRLEFAAFNDIAHLVFPIVTSPHHAAPVLRWVVQEMELRYEKMAQKGARNLADYNVILKQEGISSQSLDKDKVVLLPSIVVVIDELADLMLTAGRDIEDLITRITQMARAAGIHMIVATQRPSVDVITGLIKANFPSRISFRVASRIDSRTILDTSGADRLLGLGDMLFLDASTSQLRRVHGAYVSDQEIEQVVHHIRSQRTVEYLDIHKEMREQAHGITSTEDPLYQEICLFLNEVDEISISLVQRKFRIGYNRSARIIDVLESQGLIMPQDGGKMRKVIR